ncbi:hypothetical protein E2C01_090615 [Portunus trituberculatus]|uniref:Uncharacterized protein n=1 Tax=Portunus trituberculatus TaxID=210409 RepID=A0A5B7JLC5_PORTR|nr:hypothetical protein [Portunus trituberculatus]
MVVSCLGDEDSERRHTGLAEPGNSIGTQYFLYHTASDAAGSPSGPRVARLERLSGVSKRSEMKMNETQGRGKAGGGCRASQQDGQKTS